MTKVVLCIGDGSLESDRQSRALALQKGLDYHRILTYKTPLRPGLYHTSVYDITRGELRKKIQGYSIEVLILDIMPDAFETKTDYADTRWMINDLCQICSVQYLSERCRDTFFDRLSSNNAFCIVPFVNVYRTAVRESFCCHMSPSRQENFDFWSVKSQELRQKMLSGERVQECKKCYELEDQGAAGHRETLTYHWPGDHSIQDAEALIQDPRIRTYHLQLDNHCNLMCRMCQPECSNLVEKEYQKIKILNHSFGTHSKFDLAQINLDTVDSITVTGGEPTVNTVFLDWLEKLPQQTRQHIRILISTNAVTINRRLKKLLIEIPNMRFGVSLDGLRDVNRYIRWPTPWPKAEKNIRFLYDSGRLSHFNTAVSIYNVPHLYDLYQWIDTHYADVPCFMNMVTKPHHQIPWNRPDSLQLDASLGRIKDLKICQINQSLQENIAYIQDQLASWQFDSALLQEFFCFNDLLDRSRKVKLANFIPDLDLLRYHAGQPTT